MVDELINEILLVGPISLNFSPFLLGNEEDLNFFLMMMFFDFLIIREHTDSHTYSYDIRY